MVILWSAYWPFPWSVHVRKKVAVIVIKQIVAAVRALNWPERNWTELNWTELNGTEPNRTEPNPNESNWTEPNRTEPNWTEHNWTELNWRYWTESIFICSQLMQVNFNTELHNANSKAYNTVINWQYKP